MDRDAPVSAPVPIVIDTDPGIYDTLALTLAARWPACRLVAVTTTYGNNELRNVTRNARLVLERAGSSATVTAGADRPLTRKLVIAGETHGPGGLGDHDPGPAPEVRPSTRALVDVLRDLAEPVTLVTLGPLTNLAHALRTDAALVRAKVVKHVAMGGNLHARGNTALHSEFNAWCDPEAVAEAFAGGLRSEMVGLDVTQHLAISGDAVEKLATHDDPDARWFGLLLRFYVRFHREHEGFKGAVIHDPLAVALAIEPSWGTGSLLPLRVDLSDGGQRGRTVVGEDGDPKVLVYQRFDREKVYDLLRRQLFSPWLTPADFAP